jgi:thiol:disulfide interchange protein DsbA
MAQAYYTAETLGVGDQMHEPLFEAIHIDRLDIRDERLLAELFAEHANVSALDFSKAYSAFSVKSRVQQARAKGSAYGITGVPTMVVNGKYRVDGRMAGSNEDMLKVVDFLVAKEKAAP